MHRDGSRTKINLSATDLEQKQVAPEFTTPKLPNSNLQKSALLQFHDQARTACPVFFSSFQYLEGKSRDDPIHHVDCMNFTPSLC